MIACQGYNTRVYYRTGDGTETDATYAATETSGWYEIDNSQLIEVSVSQEEADDQDEPNTGERPVTWERPNRRLATVNRAGRHTELRKVASTWG